jgi:hypothetical protein
MRPIAAALCAMLALLWVPAAAATTIINTGSYDSGFGYVFGSTGLAPGKYRFTLDFTSPAAVDFGYVEKTTVTNIFCNDPDLGVFYCGGNDVPTLYDFTPNGAGHYQTIVTVGRPRTIPVHSHPEHPKAGRLLDRRVQRRRERQPQHIARLRRVDNPVVPQPRGGVIGIAFVLIFLADRGLEGFGLLRASISRHRGGPLPARWPPVRRPSR